MTRTELVERTAELTFDAEATRIYEVSAPGFGAPEYRCEPVVKPYGG